MKKIWFTQLRHNENKHLFYLQQTLEPVPFLSCVWVHSLYSNLFILNIEFLLNFWLLWIRTIIKSISLLRISVSLHLIGSLINYARLSLRTLVYWRRIAGSFSIFKEWGLRYVWITIYLIHLKFWNHLGKKCFFFHFKKLNLFWS